MNKKKISSIAIILPDLRFGGAEKVYLNLSNTWLTLGIDVTFILLNSRGKFKENLNKKIKIIELKVPKLRNTILPLYKIIKENNFSIILSAMWPLTSLSIVSWLLAGRKNKLFVSDHVNLSMSCKFEINFSLIFFKLILNFTYIFASGIISVSEGIKKDLLSHFFFKKPKIKTIYNPIYDLEYKKISNSYINWHNGYDYKILNVANLKIQKDHKTLIKAFYLLQKDISCELVIIGEGVLKKELIQMIDKYNLNKKIKIINNQLDINDWYESADLFVLSSKWEGLGNVLIEALQFGLKIVSTDCKFGPSEILNKGEFGLLTKVGDSKELSISMKKILYDNNFDKQKRINRAKKFEIRKIANEYLNYLQI